MGGERVPFTTRWRRRQTKALRLGAVTLLGFAASASLLSACATGHGGKAPSHPSASAASPTVSGPIRPAASAASPTVSGPVPGGMGAIVPANLTLPDVSKLGYRSAEYFLAGTASAYT